MRRNGLVVAVALVVAAVTGVGPGGAVHAGRDGAPGWLRRAPRVAVCEPLDPAQCLTPFPSDFYTRPDPTSPTGRRLDLPIEAMPRNVDGTPIDPADINRSDGFSPGSTIIVHVPGVDLAQTGLARSDDIGRSLDPDAPVVLLDAQTRRRVPYWAELDTWNSDPATRALVVRPAMNFLEGHRIVVGLRNMKNAAGEVLPAPSSFTVFRDHRPSFDPTVRARRHSMQRVFSDLSRARVHRRSLYLAWDFTVASQQGLSGWMLHMRDDAYEQLGDGVPGFTVTTVDENPNANLARRVRGTFEVPLYLSDGGAPGGRLVFGPDGMPVRTGTFQAEFRCLIPNSTVGAGGVAVPARGWVYGHGLLGGTSEIEGFAPFLNEFNVVLCATPEIGMSSGDVPNILNVISNMSTFGSIPDRLQQGLLNMQWLARLVKDPRGFGSDSAFRVGTPATAAIVPNEVFYNGNSQGGIFGGAATAISKEWTRAVLGVPGMNYSVLLPRSIDFDPFFALLSGFYTDTSEYTLIVALIQILWDRGEPNGYAQHMIKDPYPGTPNHTVLLIEAFGDHQVANVSTENEARTIGAYVNEPAIAPGRSNDVTPMWGIPPVPSSPFDGSVLEIWDFGTPAPPIDSIPPRFPEYGEDPHGAARNVAAVRAQVSAFLQPGGMFVDVCGDAPCQG